VRPRLAEAVDQALVVGEGALIAAVENEERGSKIEDREVRTEDRGSNEQQIDPQSSILNPQTSDLLLSAHYACLHCDKSYEPPSPQLFSFNSPQGMCLECDGLGMRYSFAPELLIPDPSLSFYEGAIPLIGPLRGMGRWRKHVYEGVANT